MIRTLDTQQLCRITNKFGFNILKNHVIILNMQVQFNIKIIIHHVILRQISVIEAFLSHLAREANVSASTQSQAFNALLFLYRNVSQIELTAPMHVLSGASRKVRRSTKQ